MKLKLLFNIVFLIFFVLSAFGEKIGELEGLYKPDSITVDENNLYITQELNVLVYALKNCRLLTRFGKKGSGPKEFNGFLGVVPFGESLIATSSGKISFWTKTGEYKKEVKTRSPKNGIFFPCSNGFIGQAYDMDEKNDIYITLNFYDEQLNIKKEIFRYLSSFSRRGKGEKRRFNLMNRDHRQVEVDGDYILIADPEGIIEAFDRTGTRISRIKGKYRKIPFTAVDKKDLVEKFLLANAAKSGSYNRWKSMLDFPEFFPPVQLFKVSDKKVIVLTHRREGGNGEFLVFNIKGNFIEKKMLPIKDFSPKDPYPLCFFNGKIYQIAENEDTETWELFITTVVN